MVTVIPEVKTNLQDQDMIKETHKEARTVVIDHDLRVMLVHNILLDASDANVLLA